MHIAFGISVFVFFGKYPVVKYLDHIIFLSLTFWGISILFSTVAAPIYIPTNTHEGSFSPTSLLTHCSCPFDSSYSDRCKLISHCGFDLHFPDDWGCSTSFYVSVVCLYSSPLPILFFLERESACKQGRGAEGERERIFFLIFFFLFLYFVCVCVCVRA